MDLDDKENFYADDEDSRSIMCALNSLTKLVPTLRGEVVALKTELASTRAQVVFLLSASARPPPPPATTTPVRRPGPS